MKVSCSKREDVCVNEGGTAQFLGGGGGFQALNRWQRNWKIVNFDV